MRRRDFIKVTVSAIAWPLGAARAQQFEGMRRVGVLMGYAENDPLGQASIARFRRGLEDLGWTEGRNLRIDYRWGGGDPDRERNYAAELVALAPDVLVGAGPTVRPLQQVTRTIPIVFATVVDPVGGGYVASLARPGGNTTGFAESEYAVSGKWLELLKEVAPDIKRAAVVLNPNVPGGSGQLEVLRRLAPSLAIQLYPIDLHDADEIESAITKFAGESNGGLIVTSRTSALVYRDLIVSLAARYRLPAVYSDRIFVTVGGLISYGADRVDGFRQAAVYVDRILKGEKPANLPVQAPTKYELAVNLKTAQALNLIIPQSLIATADEVIE